MSQLGDARALVASLCKAALVNATVSTKLKAFYAYHVDDFGGLSPVGAVESVGLRPARATMQGRFYAARVMVALAVTHTGDGNDENTLDGLEDDLNSALDRSPRVQYDGESSTDIYQPVTGKAYLVRLIPLVVAP